MKNIGRNNNCPCGSGKKYKKCCINTDNSLNNSKNKMSSFNRNTTQNSMSAIILKIINDVEPGFEYLDPNGQEFILSLACTTWNLAKKIDNESEHKKAIDNIIADCKNNYRLSACKEEKDNGIKSLVYILKAFTEKIQTEYSKIRTLIVNFECTEVNNRPQFKVVSCVY